MKKFLAVLSVAMMATGAFTLILKPVKAQAHQAPQYKCQFYATSNTNFLGGVYYANGVCSSAQVFGTNAVIELFPGNICSGYMVVDVTPGVCGTDLVIGNARNAESLDGGITWTYGVFQPVTMVGAEAEFDIDIVGFMKAGEVRVQCSGAGGSW